MTVIERNVAILLGSGFLIALTIIIGVFVGVV